MSAQPFQDLLAIAPLAWPLLLTGALLAALARQSWLRPLAIGGLLGLLLINGVLLDRVLAEGPQMTALGGWAAPFGIIFVADAMGALLSLAAGITALILVVALPAEDLPPRARNACLPLAIAMLAGVNGLLLSADLFNLYVWFEITLITALGLLAAGGERAQIDAALKYGVLNLVATTLFLVAVALTYGITGTLNLADLYRLLAERPADGITTTIGLLFILSVGMKSGMFPLMMWLPASYHTPPATLAAILAALVSKISLIVLVRLLSLLFAPGAFGLLYDVVLIAGVLTMVTGVAGALSERDLRRLAAYLVIAGVGFQLVVSSLGGAASFAAVVAYTAQSIPVTALLMLTVGLVVRLVGTARLDQIGGLSAAGLLAPAALLVTLMALVGLPPVSGFWPKLMGISAALDRGSGGIVAMAAILIYSLALTVAAGRVWSAVAWRPLPETRTLLPLPRERAVVIQAPVAILTLGVVAMGLLAGPWIDLATRAGADLANPEDHLRLVSPCRAQDCPARPGDRASQGQGRGEPADPAEPAAAHPARSEEPS